MTDDRDSAFLQTCVTKRLLDEDMARETFARAKRDHKPVTEVLVEMGVMAVHTVAAIEREVERALAPTIIAGFRIGAKLGQGGMGTVYQAEQVSLKREVALKIIAPHIAADQDACVRFLREARIVAAVNHPNIIGIIDAGQDGDQLFMALELVTGGDAAQLAARFSGVLPELRALEIIRDGCLGLHALYEAHLIHRDIKPSNIFIARDGVAKLADLGLARSDRGDDRMTVSGFAIGTPAFMSPEQANGDRDIDIRSDIYSLGATLYALVTGSEPFTGNGPFAIAAKVLTQPASDPRAINPAVSPATAQLILRTLAKAPASRFQTPMELHAAIMNAARELGSGPILPRPVSRSEHRPPPGADSPIAARPHPGPPPKPAASVVRGTSLPRRRPPHQRSTSLLITLALMVLAAGVILIWLGSGGHRSAPHLDADSLSERHPTDQVPPLSPPDPHRSRSTGVTPIITATQTPPPVIPVVVPPVQTATPAPPDVPTPAPPHTATPGHAPTSPIHDPVWSSASGVDRFGVWADLTVGPETQRMRAIAAGHFICGSPDNEPGHDGWETARPVTISHDFWLADSSCTQELWQQVMGNTPSAHRSAAHLPVEQVSYDDAVDFLKRLSAHLHGLRARLPTRAEYEFAVRAGTTTPYFFGTDPAQGVLYANVKESGHGGTIPVRSLRPNPWGLYDVYGNVCVWVSGGLGPIPQSDLIDPELETRDVPHIFHIRGGSFSHPVAGCRSARTGILPNTSRSDDVGFRILIEQTAHPAPSVTP